MCVYPSSAVRIRVCVSVLRALVGCKKKMVAKEFSPCDCFRPDLTNGTLTSTVNAFLSDAYTHVQAAGEPTKKSYEAPARYNISERGEVYVCVSVLGC